MVAHLLLRLVAHLLLRLWMEVHLLLRQELEDHLLRREAQHLLLGPGRQGILHGLALVSVIGLALFSVLAHG